MKRMTVCCFVLVIGMLISCSPGTTEPVQPAEQTVTAAAAETASAVQTATEAPNTVIYAYTYTREFQNIVDNYIALHPDFGYTVNWYYPPEIYGTDLDKALAAGGSQAPDIYLAESAYVGRYTQGEMSGYAMPYNDLGIDVENKIAAADTAQYIVDIGTRPSDGAVVGLAYQSTGGAFIYRRSIAKETWDTDDPAVIASKVGPGWDKFFKAAEELKEKGFSIVSGPCDIWHPIDCSAEQGWLKYGKLYIDPKREEFLDLSKEIIDNGYSNGTDDWTDEWYNDMAGEGLRPVFGFFGPAWFINYVIASHCGAELGTDYKPVKEGGTWGDWAVCRPAENFFWGGNWVLANKQLENDPAKKAAVAELIDWITLQCGEDSLQYNWANGTLDFLSVKDTVASGTVMASCDGKMDILGGQDMYDVLMPADDFSYNAYLSDYDSAIYLIWRIQVFRYAHGECTRDEAIAAFKQEVKEQLGIDAW